MKEKTVLHVAVQDPAHQTGGQGVTVEETCKAQLRMGHPVHHLSLRLSGEPQDEDFEYHEGKFSVHRISVSDSDQIDTPYAGSESQQLSRRDQFARLARSYIERYDPADTIVHLHGFYYVPLLAGQLTQYKTVSTYHLLISTRMERTGECNDVLFDLIRSFEIVSFYANRVIHAISPGMMEEILSVARNVDDPFYKVGALRLAARLGVDAPGLEEATGSNLCLEDRIHVLPHGISEMFFQPPATAKPTSRPLVVAWGRVSSEKGFEYLIEAARKCPEIDFRIWGTTGNGERERDQYKVQLDDLADGLVNVELDFRPWGIRGDELIQSIDAADLVIMPSLYEPFGLVLVEALARAKPVVTPTTAGGKYIMAAAGATSLPYGFVITDDASALADNILSAVKQFFAQSEQQRSAMAKAARQHAEPFRWHAIAEKLGSLYS